MTAWNKEIDDLPTPYNEEKQTKKMPKGNKKIAGKSDPVDETRRSTPRSTRQQTIQADTPIYGALDSSTPNLGQSIDGPTINLAIQDLDNRPTDILNDENNASPNVHSTPTDIRQRFASNRSEDNIDIYNRLEILENNLKRASIEINISKAALDAVVLVNKTLDHKVLYLEQRITELEHHNNRMQFQVDSSENFSRAKNIKIDGIAENQNEDLIGMICDLAKEEGKTVTKHDIEAAFRLGKFNPQSKKPRQVMIKFKDQNLRNDVLFSKGLLKGKQAFRRIWINDDVSEGTRKLREEARTINLYCKEQGIPNTKVHGDGIIVNDKKFKLNELKTLPANISLEKAKTVKRENHIYFQSEASKFSNFYRCEVPLTDGTFTSSEQAYQWRKAMHAKDYELATYIKAETNPMAQKRLGDKIPNSQDWNTIKVVQMYEILNAKFNASVQLKTALLDTEGHTLHEATRDSYWGIGAMLYGEEARQHTWLGKDQLGIVLGKVRTSLKQTTV